MSDIYLVIVENAGEDDLTRILGFWEQSYAIVSDGVNQDDGESVTILLVRDAERTTRGIAAEIRKDNDDVRCVVFDVGDAPYGGYYYTALWEWLRKGNR